MVRALATGAGPSAGAVLSRGPCKRLLEGAAKREQGYPERSVGGLGSSTLLTPWCCKAQHLPCIDLPHHLSWLAYSHAQRVMALSPLQLAAHLAARGPLVALLDAGADPLAPDPLEVGDLILPKAGLSRRG